MKHFLAEKAGMFTTPMYLCQKLNISSITVRQCHNVTLFSFSTSLLLFTAGYQISNTLNRVFYLVALQFAIHSNPDTHHFRLNYFGKLISTMFDIYILI